MTVDVVSPRTCLYISNLLKNTRPRPARFHPAVYHLMSHRRKIRCLWSALRNGLKNADLIQLSKMPVSIGGILNPLALLPEARAANLNGNILLGDLFAHAPTFHAVVLHNAVPRI